MVLRRNGKIVEGKRTGDGERPTEWRGHSVGSARTRKARVGRNRQTGERLP